eukprot:scaffold4963_cov97-Isochrysis_galbana.AAC.2
MPGGTLPTFGTTSAFEHRPAHWAGLTRPRRESPTSSRSAPGCVMPDMRTRSTLGSVTPTCGSASGLWEKQRKHLGERRIIRIPRTPPPSHGFQSRVPDVARVGQAYARTVLDLTASPHHSSSNCLERLLPPLVARSMSASLSPLRASSAAEAIKVPRARGDWLGGWAPGSATRDKHYIDPTVEPTPAAYRLLGWLLDSEYVVHRARPAHCSSLPFRPRCARGVEVGIHTPPQSL